MKQLLITSAMILAFFIGISKTKSVNTKDLDYVVTEKGIFTPEDTRLALQGKLYMNQAGETITLKFSDINTIIIDGKAYRVK